MKIMPLKKHNQDNHSQVLSLQDCSIEKSIIVTVLEGVQYVHHIYYSYVKDTSFHVWNTSVLLELIYAVWLIIF